MRLAEEPDDQRNSDLPAELLAVAMEAAQVAAGLAVSWRERADQLRIDEKTGPHDLVSQADREVEDAVRAVVGRHRPADGVLGEEGGESRGTSGIDWIIDPIDGTLSYLYGKSDWTISVAAARSSNSELLAGVVAAPMLNQVTTASLGGGTWFNGRRAAVRDTSDLTHAVMEINFGRGDRAAKAGRMVDALMSRIRHIRRGGSTAGALVEVALGHAEAAWSPGTQPWDVAAGVLLVREAGGQVGDLNGVVTGTWPASLDVLAASPALWEPLRTLLEDVYRG